MILLFAALLALSPAEHTAASRITSNEISGHLRFLADDLLEGRKPGTPGDSLAVLYLASQLEAFGYKPGGDNGSFLQQVPLVELHIESPREVTFQAGGQPLALKVLGGSAADLI